jgi:hypothetical protein
MSARRCGLQVVSSPATPPSQRAVRAWARSDGLALPPILCVGCASDPPDDHPDDPSGSVWIHPGAVWTDEASNLSRRQFVWTRLDRRRASVS